MLGYIIPRLESGWLSVAVKFFDVLFATWLVQSLSRILWKRMESGSLFNIAYSESLTSPADPTKGTIFNSFSEANQNVSLPIYYSGHHFGMDIISSIFSLLWNHVVELLALWFILEALGYLWASTSRLVIVDTSSGGEKQDTKEKKDDSKKAEPSGPNLADLLVFSFQNNIAIY